MNSLLEKASYLKGLTEGLEISTKTSEGKLLKALVEFVGEISKKVEELDNYCNELEEYIGEVDKDLGELEDECYDLNDEDYDFYEFKCPSCDETVYIDDEDLDSDEDISCPNCGEKIELDFSCDDECGCGCGCDDEE